MNTLLTVRQIMDLGLWDKVCEYKGINPWALNEGLIAEDEVIEFDSEFKTDEELENELQSELEKYKILTFKVRGSYVEISGVVLAEDIKSAVSN